MSEFISNIDVEQALQAALATEHSANTIPPVASLIEDRMPVLASLIEDSVPVLTEESNKWYQRVTQEYPEVDPGVLAMRLLHKMTTERVSIDTTPVVIDLTEASAATV